MLFQKPSKTHKIISIIKPTRPIGSRKDKTTKPHPSIFIALPPVVMAILAAMFFGPSPDTHASACPDLRIIFARGSGAERDTDDSYLEFKRTIEAKIKNWGITHDYVDLPYEARGIGVDNILTLFGAFFGAGDAYEFGASVENGIELLASAVSACPDTKFVLGGYSQGAMVVSGAIHSIDPQNIIYAATFGDPKIYLPEGKAWFAFTPLEAITGTDKNLFRTGAIPVACKGENLSEYRMYVPDCYAYEGILGSHRPYQPLGYEGKLGTWCNRYDVLCSSYLDVSSHTSYIKDGLYEDAAKVIAAKIAQAFEIKDTSTSPHDTAILIDSTGSMSSLINGYKNEALRLAEKTLDSGGRVALYDYRDLAEGYTPIKHCDFETCTLETFQAGLDSIAVANGGDTPESLLSASLHVMKDLNWQFGSTKSLVILTDAGYHSPDLDGTTFYDVTKLSKQIDPVNFYIITKDSIKTAYDSLANATGGAVASSADDLSILTDIIMSRYDSLPRVEEEFDDEDYDTILPVLKVTNCTHPTATSAKIAFKTNGAKTLVALDDAILGSTADAELIITDLDTSRPNTLTLIPMTSTRRGESVTVDLSSSIVPEADTTVIIPRTPNTGCARL